MRKGICKNIGPCTKANSEEKQEIVDDLASFECLECGSSLNEVVDVKPKPQFPKWLIPTLGGLALLILLFIFGPPMFKEKNDNKIRKTLNNESSKSITDSLILKTDQGKKIANNGKSISHTSTHTNLKKDANGGGRPSGESNDKSFGKSQPKIVKTLNFSFGYYKGETINNLMNGNGTLYFTQGNIISSKDPKQRLAEAGDYVSGSWFEGFLDQGKWFNKASEQKETIIIGH